MKKSRPFKSEAIPGSRRNVRRAWDRYGKRVAVRKARKNTKP